MKSRTSFFNAAILKKNIGRFAPVWSLYTIYLLFYIYLNNFGDSAAEEAYYLTANIPFLFLIYAFICSTMLFGDLFKSRICNALHAMPLRRESWFFVHLLSGVLFAVVPHTIVAIAMSFSLTGEYISLAWLWWLVANCSFLFHFALAALCAMCAGTRFGHAVVFTVLSGLPQWVFNIYTAIYQPMLYGISASNTFVSMICPASYFLLEARFFQWENGVDLYANQYTPIYNYLGIIPKDWIYLACCVAAAIALLFAGMYLYRCRKLEWAGDFVNYTVLQWSILILGSFLMGTIIPVIGFPVGFFCICMLLERRVKVFHKKNWLCFGLLTATVLITLGLTWMDPLFLVNRVPKHENVESVSLNFSYGAEEDVIITSREGVQDVIAFHEYLLENRNLESNYISNFTLTYNLKNGGSFQRQYFITTDSSAFLKLKPQLSSFEVLFGTTDVESVINKVYLAELEYTDGSGKPVGTGMRTVVPEEWTDELILAIAEDCEKSRLAQPGLFHLDPYNFDLLHLWYEGENGPEEYVIRIYSDSQTTYTFPHWVS